VQRVITWKFVAKTGIISFCGLFILTHLPVLRDTEVGGWLLEHFLVEWLLVLLILLPVRVFLDRRVARQIHTDWKAGKLTPGDLSASQRAAILSQAFRWPRGLRWLGSRWIERAVWTFIILLAAAIVVPLIIVGVMYVLQRFAS
jgi:hypothetical protein